MDQNTLIDDYEHLNNDIEYVLENILQEDDDSEEFRELKDMYNSNIIKSCECVEENCENCCHGGNYVVKNDQIILNESRPCQDLIYECHELCKCFACNNRLVQFGPRLGLKIQNFESKGLGLVSTKDISKGSFICEYAGEILTKSEAIKRDQQNMINKRMNFIFCLNEIASSGASNEKIQTFIDPSMKGNIARYINHSCDANCNIISTRIDCIIPKIAIFANRDIPSMTEITFNYGTHGNEFTQKGMTKPCYCKSINCNLVLPNFSF